MALGPGSAFTGARGCLSLLLSGGSRSGLLLHPTWSAQKDKRCPFSTAAASRSRSAALQHLGQVHAKNNDISPLRRLLTTSPPPQQNNHNDSSRSSAVEVDGATEISHSHFISSASPSSDFNPTQSPHAGTSTSDTSASPWQGHLSPTRSHLFKLILPLPSSSSTSKPPGSSPSSHSPSSRTRLEDTLQPTAFLLHPSQPLSHLSRLITGSLPIQYRDAEISYLALTGQEDDLDSHLRNAEEEEKAREETADNALQAEEKSSREEGGPFLGEREKAAGRWQEVSWSQSTDLSDFIKQSCLNERFKIVIEPQGQIQLEDGKGQEGKVNSDGDGDRDAGKHESGKEGNQGMTLEVLIPSFASRTTYIRKRLLALTKELDTMTKKKKKIDLLAHQSAQRLAVGALAIGVAYWIAVIRFTFFTSAGWDIMEPVTWATGFGALLCSCAFLVYHNREVSYSSLLDLSITARQRALYDKHGLDIERWTEMVAEAKTLRREVARIAADYDIEWKGELENLAKDSRPLERRLKSEQKLGSTKDRSDNEASVAFKASRSKEGAGGGRSNSNGARRSQDEDGVKSQDRSSKDFQTSDRFLGSAGGASGLAGTTGQEGKSQEVKANKQHDKDEEDDEGKQGNNEEEENDEDDDNENENATTIDIDKTIDEAAEMAEQSEEKRSKEKAAQRKGEVLGEGGSGGDKRRRKRKEGEERKESEMRGMKRGEEVVDGR